MKTRSRPSIWTWRSSTGKTTHSTRLSLATSTPRLATEERLRNSTGRLPRWTWELPTGEYHNEIDHIIVNRRFCLTDVGVVPKFYTGSDHRLLRARFFFSRKGEKAATSKKRSPKPTFNWDLFTTLDGF
ncbi:hypothetical protein Y032_0164g3552 [Ancylostoma ceylanicum]|uniref:Endonuclease/exonuclease/phosphatase domain-containing protein n=1 Tax=Ancylostoma ceylanicum TaxID=53326 RepID=A0A016SXP2_9BILA|nr:hypothetical protein Y032_0164g3552 [Ancylostoma ceylanicum]